MGADLILAYLAVDKGQTLDWSQVDAALAAIPDDDIGRMLDDACGGPQAEDPTPETDRAEVRKLFKDLQELIEDGSRDLTWLDIKGLRLYISGGMSWGDMPTEASDILSRTSYFEPILKAVGFNFDWWEES